VKDVNRTRVCAQGANRRLRGSPLSTLAAVGGIALTLSGLVWGAALAARLRGLKSTVAGAGVTGPAGPGAGGAAEPHAGSFAVGIRVLHLVDRSRLIRLAGGRTEPRSLPTYVRYPASGGPSASDVPDAPAARTSGAFPLLVFAHGYDVTPAIYARLLDSWARAGYVVAAPVFPLESPGAPGGPTRSDLVNEPRDVSFVISQLRATSDRRAGPLAGLLDSSPVALAGQSDGGEVALAGAYSRGLADPRVGAAVVLSGAEMSGAGGFPFHHGEPPLLAVQGTADQTNEPRFTYAFFARARRPKFLLRLLGAGHLPPYTGQQPQLSVVERVSIAFLNAYIKRTHAASHAIAKAGNVARVANLVADP
jgi:hypothetical protein